MPVSWLIPSVPYMPSKQAGVKSGVVNINAAPLDIDGFRLIKEAGIGTYQIFQETYHPSSYEKYHPSGKKHDYGNRLCALDRAQLAGLDDVGIGALFGLYSWKFEVMALVRHTNHLEACFNAGHIPFLSQGFSLHRPLTCQLHILSTMRILPE